jgi:hypothetical protein
MVIAQTQQQLLVTLSANKDRAFRNALQELAERLKQGKVSEDCKKNVLDKLNTIEGFDLQKFIGFLQQGGDFYDGEKSNAPVSDYDPDNGWTISIAKRFEINEGLHAFVGRGSKVSRFTVFFDPDEIETKEKTSLISGQKVSGLTTSNLAFAFHEALHGYGQSIGKLQGETPPYGDTNLKDVLGLKGEGSKIISDHIEKNCFK